MADAEVMQEIRAAIHAGETQKVLAMIGENKARLEMMTPFGTWLHVASKVGKLEIVRGIVGLGSDVNRRGGTFGGSAINLAAAYGQREVVDFLLNCGAELDVSEPERNPLFSAIQGGHLEIAKLLIKHGIDTKISYTGPSMHDMTAHAFACERGQTDIAAILEDI